MYRFAIFLLLAAVFISCNLLEGNDESGQKLILKSQNDIKGRNFISGEAFQIELENITDKNVEILVGFYSGNNVNNDYSSFDEWNADFNGLTLNDYLHRDAYPGSQKLIAIDLKMPKDELCFRDCKLRIMGINSANGSKLFNQMFDVSLNFDSQDNINKVADYFPVSRENFWVYEFKLRNYDQEGLMTTRFKVFQEEIQTSENGEFTDLKFGISKADSVELEYWRFPKLEEGVTFGTKSSSLYPFRVRKEGINPEFFIPLAFKYSHLTLEKEYSWLEISPEDTVTFFNRNWESKIIRLRTIWDHKEYSFLKGIGIYRYNSVNDHDRYEYILKGAFVNGVAYGDTSFTN